MQTSKSVATKATLVFKIRKNILIMYYYTSEHIVVRMLFLEHALFIECSQLLENVDFCTSASQISTYMNLYLRLR